MCVRSCDIVLIGHLLALTTQVLGQWPMFIPVQTFNFLVTPPHLRIPLLTCAGFCYSMGLSYLHGDLEHRA